MPTTFKKTKSSGCIDPTRRYTAQGLLKAGGFGPDTLAEMRASGIVKPIDIGNYRWYRGDEVCQWIDSKQED